MPHETETDALRRVRPIQEHGPRRNVQLLRHVLDGGSARTATCQDLLLGRPAVLLLGRQQPAPQQHSRRCLGPVNREKNEQNIQVKTRTIRGIRPSHHLSPQ